jgi:hypothetical protein
MAFGAGVLIAALTFSLIEEAYNLVNDLVPVILGYTWRHILLYCQLHFEQKKQRYKK